MPFRCWRVDPVIKPQPLGTKHLEEVQELSSCDWHTTIQLVPSHDEYIGNEEAYAAKKVADFCQQQISIDFKMSKARVRRTFLGA